MSRRSDDLNQRDSTSSCAMSAFIGGLAGGLIASLIMAGVMMLEGAS